MRRLAFLLLFLVLGTSVADARLSTTRRFHAPLLQILPAGGGSGTTTIVSGTTTITGGGANQVCFNSAGTLACGSSAFLWQTPSAGVAGVTITAAQGTLGWEVTDGTLRLVGTLDAAVPNAAIRTISNHGIIFGVNSNSQVGLNGSALQVVSGHQIGWSSSSTAPLTAADTGLERVSAAVVGVTNGSTGDGQLQMETTGQRVASNNVALTEAGGAETVITITTTTTQTFGLELSYRVTATDATPDYAVREGSLKLVCVNNATVMTCTKDATAQTDDESVLINTTAKTLTYAIAVDVATASVAKITFDIDSDMTVTAASITWTVILNGSGTIS